MPGQPTFNQCTGQGNSGNAAYLPSETLRSLIRRRLEEQKECLEEVIDKYLDPLIEAAEAGQAFVTDNPTAQKGPGDLQVSGPTRDFITEILCSPTTSIYDQGYQMPPRLPPIPGMNRVAPAQPEQDPLLRYDTLSEEIKALARLSKNTYGNSNNPFQATADSFEDRNNPTEAQRKKLMRILNPTGAKKDD